MKVSAFAITMLAASGAAFEIPDEIKEYIRLFDSAVLIGLWKTNWETYAYSLGRDYVCSNYALTSWPDIIGGVLGGFTAADVTAAFDSAGVTAESICIEGYDKMWSALWYSYDEKPYYFGVGWSDMATENACTNCTA